MRLAGRDPRKGLVVVAAHGTPAHVPVLQLLRHALGPLAGHILAIVAVDAREQLLVVRESQLGAAVAALKEREVDVAAEVVQRDAEGLGVVVGVGELHGQVPDEGAEVGGRAAVAGGGVEVVGVGDGGGGGVGAHAETLDGGAGVAGVEVGIGYVGGRVGGDDAESEGGGLGVVLGRGTAGEGGAEEGGCCAELHVEGFGFGLGWGLCCGVIRTGKSG